MKGLCNRTSLRENRVCSKRLTNQNADTGQSAHKGTGTYTGMHTYSHTNTDMY
jgi:hypothetical protein